MSVSPSGSDADGAAPTNTLPLEIQGAADIGGPPRVTYVKIVGEFAAEVLAEASRIEVATRGSSSDAIQYTSSHFEKANFFVRDRGFLPARSKWEQPARIANPIAFLAAGICGPNIFIDDANRLWILGTVVSTVVGVVALIIDSEARRGR